jgi:putative hydrolase of the HAD superfamily
VFEVTPDDAVYVGDRLHTDAIGAARAGLRGVWIDRTGAATAAQLAEAAAEGVAVIRGLAELPLVLG